MLPVCHSDEGGILFRSSVYEIASPVEQALESSFVGMT